MSKINEVCELTRIPGTNEMCDMLHIISLTQAETGGYGSKVRLDFCRNPVSDVTPFQPGDSFQVKVQVQEMDPEKRRKRVE